MNKRYGSLLTGLALAFLGSTTSASGVTLTLVNNTLPANPPGAEVGFLIKGEPNLLTILGVDTDPGPAVAPFGVVNLGLTPDFFTVRGVSDQSGCLRIDCIVNCADPLLGMTLYLQALQIDSGQVCISNPETVLWDALNGECGGEDLCPGMGTKPQVLTMVYTGEDCSASNNSQSAGKVTCSGDPAFASPVHIIATTPSGMDIWFEGDVALGGSFDIDAALSGKTRLKGDTVVEVYDAAGGTLLHSVQFHTSCSEPLIAGEQYGALVLTGFVAEP